MKDRIHFIFYIIKLIIFLSLIIKIKQIKSHPTLVECICNKTLTAEAQTVTSTGTSTSTNSNGLKMPECVEDIFAETGIRWYINGNIDPNINYWKNTGVQYSDGRAAKRLIRFGYKCTAYQLKDPNEAEII